MAMSIAFLMPVPFTEHHARRYGLRALEHKGISTYILDLSKLFNRDVPCRTKESDPLQKTKVLQISSYAELEEKMKVLSKTAVFVDYMAGLSGIDLKHEKVFRMLKRCHASYYVISDADLPAPYKKEGNSAKKFVEKYARVFDRRCVGGAIAKIMLRLLVKLGFYPLPVKAFGTDSDNMRNYLRKYDDGSIRCIPINSFDYSVYLEYVKSNKEPGIKAEKTCVFLDEDAMHSIDFEILKIKKIDSQRYLNTMNQLFDRIEKETGLEVIIASHPMSHYEDYSDAFSGRKIIKGKTVELVAQSSLVIFHSSTAVSYPVLFNKPTLIVKTEDMIQAGRGVLIDALAEELGLEPMNVNDEQQLAKLTQLIRNATNNKFDRYKSKYLLSEGLEEFSTWDIIAQELNKEPVGQKL